MAQIILPKKWRKGAMCKEIQSELDSISDEKKTILGLTTSRGEPKISELWAQLHNHKNIWFPQLTLPPFSQRLCQRSMAYKGRWELTQTFPSPCADLLLSKQLALRTSSGHANLSMFKS